MGKKKGNCEKGAYSRSARRAAGWLSPTLVKKVMVGKPGRTWPDHSSPIGMQGKGGLEGKKSDKEGC